MREDSIIFHCTMISLSQYLGRERSCNTWFGSGVIEDSPHQLQPNGQPHYESPTCKSYGSWASRSTARMTLHICFNRCYIVMQACVQFPEVRRNTCIQAAFISKLYQSDRRTAAARRNRPNDGRLVIGRPAATLPPAQELACLPYRSQNLAHITSPATSFSPRAHADRHASCRQTKNRMKANLVSFVPVEAYKVLILDRIYGLLIINRLISPLSHRAPSDTRARWPGRVRYRLIFRTLGALPIPSFPYPVCSTPAIDWQVDYPFGAIHISLYIY